DVSEVPIVNGTDEDGDGVLDGEPIEPGFRKYVYAGEHIYSQAGRYVLSVENPNRLPGILNLNFPNSVSIPVYTETEIEVFANSTRNSTPVLLEPGGVDQAHSGLNYLHLPNAYDHDDDSIAYQLIVPLQGPDDPIPNYFGIGDLATIDSEKGIFNFSNAQEGMYGFAIQINSYRNGVLQDRMIRDITFFNRPINANSPPTISVDTPLEIIQEVNIGDTVRFQCTVADSPGQTIRLSATSGLFSYIDAPATFTVEQDIGTFEWIVRDEHARTQAYPVVIKAEDDLDEFAATNFALIRYRVNGGVVRTNEPVVGAWLVYPNPVSDELFLRAPGVDFPLPITYKIFNTSGQLVAQARLNNWSARIDVASLASGTYFLQLETAEQQWTEPFVKR
ncbi:MAG: T9SS type A sorting domain-containing protein, partial [Bacteroidota bacterium]